MSGNFCGHCKRPMRGFAMADGVYLCHPDVGMDCYHLVTVYGHEVGRDGSCQQCANPETVQEMLRRKIDSLTAAL